MAPQARLQFAEKTGQPIEGTPLVSEFTQSAYKTDSHSLWMQELDTIQ